jgi:hypothetical protein
MTTRWPRPVVAVLCTLLAVATPAAAACAWVAWQGGISEIDMHDPTARAAAGDQVPWPA